MKVECINPFIQSVSDLFSTMLSADAKRGDIQLSKSLPTGHEILAIIGLSGTTRGTVALSFPLSTAKTILERFIGEDPGDDNEALTDGLAELVNIVAGGAKAKFNGEGQPPITLSLPTVISGTEYKMNFPSNSMWLDVPFDSQLGNFSLSVTIECTGKNAKGGDAS